MLFFDDPLTRFKRARIKRQKQVSFYLVTGLVLGASLMNISLELYRGVVA